ncbi:unnamed protein product [Lactuca virosa]|uniref:Glycosyltransferases n=1 Tax=Lactuca virosa TaxID=75947 RepID=A0AAU9NIH8_9ASTR|nr:unnamed protein product [Lactuca virosa]
MNFPYEVVWIVVEAVGTTNETAALLAKLKLQIKHIGFKKKMPIFWNARHKLESEMRLQALRVVREEKLDGIVMFADDSNMHSLELFDEIQKVEWIGTVSVGILLHSSHSNEDPFEVQKNLNEPNNKKSPLATQGPACNSSDHSIGWHTFNFYAYEQKSANYIGDMAIVLPQKLEWSGFVMNSILVWEESEFKPEWIKDLNEVDEIENPLSLLKDSSMVERSCDFTGGNSISIVAPCYCCCLSCSRSSRRCQHGGRVLLADKMGLGKTLQILKKLEGVHMIKGPNPSYNDICFSGAGSDVSQLSKIFPSVDMFFGKGQKLSLSPENYLFRVEVEYGTYFFGRRFSI